MEELIIWPCRVSIWSTVWVKENRTGMPAGSAILLSYDHNIFYSQWSLSLLRTRRLCPGREGGRVIHDVGGAAEICKPPLSSGGHLVWLQWGSLRAIGHHRTLIREADNPSDPPQVLNTYHGDKQAHQSCWSTKPQSAQQPSRYPPLHPDTYASTR